MQNHIHSNSPQGGIVSSLRFSNSQLQQSVESNRKERQSKLILTIQKWIFLFGVLIISTSIQAQSLVQLVSSSNLSAALVLCPGIV